MAEIAEAAVINTAKTIGKINYKALLFFILLPIYAPLSIFLHLTFDWWQGLLD